MDQQDTDELELPDLNPSAIERIEAEKSVAEVVLRNGLIEYFASVARDETRWRRKQIGDIDEYAKRYTTRLFPIYASEYARPIDSDIAIEKLLTLSVIGPFATATVKLLAKLLPETWRRVAWNLSGAHPGIDAGGQDPFAEDLVNPFKLRHLKKAVMEACEDQVPQILAASRILRRAERARVESCIVEGSGQSLAGSVAIPNSREGRLPTIQDIGLALESGDRKRAVRLRIEMERCSVKTLRYDAFSSRGGKEATKRTAFNRWQASRSDTPSWAGELIRARLLKPLESATS